MPLQAATVGGFGLGVQAWFGREPFDTSRVAQYGWPANPCLKPNHGFFTSSWDDERKLSSWMESASFRERGDEGRTLTLLRPTPTATIMVIESPEGFRNLANEYPQPFPNSARPPCPSWRRLVEVVDAIHVTESAVSDPEDFYSHAWEVESTLWLRGDVLDEITHG